MVAASGNTASAYRKAQLEGSSPEQILLYLMEAAIRHTKKARSHAEQEEFPRALEEATNALNIVTELDNTLDQENGGEIMDELEALYAFVSREIIQANKDREYYRLEGVEDVLQTLYQGWKDAVDEVQQGQPAATGA